MESKNNLSRTEVLLALLLAIIGVLLLANPIHSLLIVGILMMVIFILYAAKWYGEKYQINTLLLSTLVTLYSVTVVTSVIAATKIIRFDIRWITDLLFSGEMSVPAGVIVYAASFLITDLISEVYGRKNATATVYLGFISMLIFSLYSLIMVRWHQASYWELQDSFEKIVGLSLRITFAGWFSFIISQHWDVAIFHWLKGKKELNQSNNEQKCPGGPSTEPTGGKLSQSNNEQLLPALWVRNNLSTITSQFIDSTLFISIAFLGQYDNQMVVNMIFAQWFIKCIIALIDTPFAYWGRQILMSFKEKNCYEKKN